MAAKASLALALAAVLGASACSPIVQRHGYVPTEDDLSQIVPGVDDRGAVLDLLPPPTTTGVDGNLYFVSSEFRALGPLARREVSREVVAITMGEGDLVTGVERYGLSDGRVVALSRRVTRENVRDTTFLRQLMGNLGRFDAGTLVGEQ